MKKIILAAALTAFSTLSFAQPLPDTKVLTMQVECGESKEIKRFLGTVGTVPVLEGTTLNAQMPGGKSTLMMNPKGVYALVIESENGEFACVVDYGKFAKPGTRM